MKLSSQQEKEDRHKNKEQVDMCIVVQPINLVHKWVLALETTLSTTNTSLKMIRKIEIPLVVRLRVGLGLTDWSGWQLAGTVLILILGFDPEIDKDVFS